MLKIIKRDGTIQEFDRRKIENAIHKAFLEVDGEISEYAKTKARHISAYIEELVRQTSDTDNLYDIEQIQDFVENGLMSTKRKDVARAYILYRDKRTKARKNNGEDTILEIVEGKNKYYAEENSNKNHWLLSTQRDYVAGEESAIISDRKLLPKDIVEADKKGIIHFHDKDYFLQSMHNCDLINLEDMLQNGTVISETWIDKPHTFSTACTITTQIIAQCASSQYGK